MVRNDQVGCAGRRELSDVSVPSVAVTNRDQGPIPRPAALRLKGWGWSVLGVAFVLICGSKPAGALAEVQPYLRSVHGPEGRLSLEVALRRLAPTHGEGSAVWLAAVTHMGTREYYRQLQRFLDNCSLVLFEAVRTDDEGLPGGQEGYSLQADLAGALGLAFQLEAVDYDRPHFRNSDLHLEQLTRILASQTNEVPAAPGAGPPVSGAVEFGALMQTMTGEGLMGGLARMGVALLRASTRLQAATKAVLIETLSELPADLSRTPGLPEGMQRLLRVLIEERNAAVVSDVREALGKSPAPASVAVFYGAGHMADLEARLCRDLGYQPAEERWLAAFDVNPRAMGVSEFEVTFTTRLVRAQLQGLERGSDRAASVTNAPAAAPGEH